MRGSLEPAETTAIYRRIQTGLNSVQHKRHPIGDTPGAAARRCHSPTSGISSRFSRVLSTRACLGVKRGASTRVVHIRLLQPPPPSRVPKSTCQDLPLDRTFKPLCVDTFLLLMGTSLGQHVNMTSLHPRDNVPATEGPTRTTDYKTSTVYRICPGGGIGRRNGLKIRRPSGHGGSSPPLGTILESQA